MRRRHNIKGTDCGMCSCFSCLCEGDEEKIEDFCLYLCCAPCATCQETRHLSGGGSMTMMEAEGTLYDAQRARRRRDWGRVVPRRRRGRRWTFPSPLVAPQK